MILNFCAKIIVTDLSFFFIYLARHNNNTKDLYKIYLMYNNFRNIQSWTNFLSWILYKKIGGLKPIIIGLIKKKFFFRNWIWLEEVLLDHKNVSNAIVTSF